jgi:argonaute-like protein implicated in RNA metabolism and viral defense
MPHLITGIYARAGNIPYLLAEPLTYTDFVVGLDVFREQKKSGETLTSLARVYRKDGALVQSQIVNTPLSANEAIPYEVFDSLFPRKLFARKRALIHNDGHFRHSFLESLMLWGDEIGATFYPVEIVRRGVPRLYSLANGKVDSPPYGATFRLNDHEAFVVVSVSPEDATPHPLHIHCEEPLTIEQAIHSVMAFTTLHYGAFKTPKLPVTIHNSDYLRESFLRGITPEKLEGSIPYWL